MTRPTRDFDETAYSKFVGLLISPLFMVAAFGFAVSAMAFSIITSSDACLEAMRMSIGRHPSFSVPDGKPIRQEIRRDYRVSTSLSKLLLTCHYLEK